MIVLDTNVLSEALRAAPSAVVMAWLSKQSNASLFTTTVTRGELFYGIELLPDGQRKNDLGLAAQGIFDQDLVGQVLSFDTSAADALAAISAARKRAGHPISQFDAMIAAITQSRGAKLATRNIKDFVNCGIELIDPWSEL